jgi:antitoxin component of MazEF toxin-antitoxin module
MDIQYEVTLRQVGGSLHMIIPAYVKNALGLTAGDAALVEGNENGCTLKFFKVTRNKIPVGNGDAAQQTVFTAEEAPAAM